MEALSLHLEEMAPSIRPGTRACAMCEALSSSSITAESAVMGTVSGLSPWCFGATLPFTTLCAHRGLHPRAVFRSTSTRAHHPVRGLPCGDGVRHVRPTREDLSRGATRGMSTGYSSSCDDAPSTPACLFSTLSLWGCVTSRGLSTRGRGYRSGATEGRHRRRCRTHSAVASSLVTYSVSLKTPSSKASRTLPRAPVVRIVDRSTLATADCCESTPTRRALARPAEKIIEGAVIDARRSARPSGFVRLHARARAL